MGIADRLEYKILTDDRIDIDTSDSALKRYWEANKQKYLTPRSYTVEYIEQPAAEAPADEKTMRAYYDSHKHSFVGPDGKLLPYESAKSAVKAALDDKAANKAALKTYIAYKKGRLGSGIAAKKVTVSENDGTFDAGTFKAIAAATMRQPYIKPKKDHGRYIIIKLLGITEPAPKSFDAAKAEVLADYKRDTASKKLIETAKNEIKTFKGKTTATYLTRTDTEGIDGLDADETAELLGAVFKSDRSRGMAGLKTHKMVLYHIVDQKIGNAEDPDTERAVEQTKSALLSEGLIKRLNRRYETKIFIEGFGR